MKSWKQEFDAKYKRLLNTGNIKVIDDTNDVLLRAMSELDTLIKKHLPKKTRA